MSDARLARVLLYSHDTYGMGHLRRNLAIARELLTGGRGTRVVLASGSPVLDRVTRPAGLSCVKLPPVVKTGPDQYRSVDPRIDVSLVTRARSAVLCDVVARWQPDVLLVDHAPHGMRGELLPVFETVRRRSPRTSVVLGLRDILDDPEQVRASWQAGGIYQTLQEVYDAVVVYGDRDVFDLAEAYGIPHPLAEQVSYCGYVSNPRPVAPRRPEGLNPSGDYLLGTVGGGGDGVEVLAATAHAAVAANVEAVLCTGPLMSQQDRDWLARQTSGGPGLTVVEHLPDLAAVAAGASAVISRGGYNSLVELIGLGVPTVVVPRVWPRVEQLLRAHAFAERGLVRVVNASPESLVAEVSSAVRAVLTEAPVPRHMIDLDGARRVVQTLRRCRAIEAPSAGSAPELRSVDQDRIPA